MRFNTEPTGYEKTILSDLQGARGFLHAAVADHPGFTGWDKVLFHIDEAMSWESVRNLQQMNHSLLLVRNLTQQGDALEQVLECLVSVDELMRETLKTLDTHKI